MSIRHSIADWFDERTGYRAGLEHLLDEPIPANVNWWFTLGSVLLFLLVVQIVTGAVLTMYYVPTPTYAYDSVRYITTQLTFGHALRGLHFFGASFIVVAAGLHLLRVLFFGAYKKPREVTWWTGIFLLLVIMAFALTGYLLPWDERAYWATVVTINIAKRTPIVGPFVASLLRGGPEVGALTLSRWFAVHVILLPAALVALTGSHLYLMRRHGIAGHFRPKAGTPNAFYPGHAIKDTIVIAAVFAALFSFAVFARAPLEAMADPSNANYTPRPEWYFLGLFQLLKYFPGRLEPIGAQVIPGLTMLLLVLLPFLDRGDERHPLRRGVISGIAVAVVAAALVLTGLGLRDHPHNADTAVWTPRAIAGLDLASTEKCTRCHSAGGAGPDLTRGRITRDDRWIEGHVADPEMIAPGLRKPPPGGLNIIEARAVVAYVGQVRAGAAAPTVAGGDRLALDVFGTKCIACHILNGDGGKKGPDLTHAAKKPGHDAAWFERWITDPSAVDPIADMPAFGGKLSDAEMNAVSAWLASKK
ncbi:MAG: cytochrome b N-terminal domain-containing protein [Solirubrobacteraceae bacterium]